MILNRDAILNCNDITIVEIDIPEWGGTVKVKALNGSERDSFEASLVLGSGANVKMNMENIRAKFVVRCLIDDQGKRLFADADAEILAQKSAAALDRIFDVAQKLSGIGDKELKELVKNSEADQREDSILS